MSVAHFFMIVAGLTLFIGGGFGAFALVDPYAGNVARCFHVAALLAIAVSGFVFGRATP